ncbi:MAG: lytic transglycosylase domain-containing protein, partial [Chthoniobacterales bacterium]
MPRLTLPLAAALSCCFVLVAQAQSPKPKGTPTHTATPKPTAQPAAGGTTASAAPAMTAAT